MIRLLIAGVMMLMAGNANAVLNKDLYLFCNSFLINNFKAEKSDHFVCMSYFVGIGESSRNWCILQEFGGITYKVENVNASIQHYLDEMKKTPEEWEETAALEVWASLAQINGTDCPPKE